jgi:hypothetical protein
MEKQLPDSQSRGVSDSLTRRVRESPILRLAEFSFKHSKDDSPSRRVVFRLQISPRIRSQNQNGSKGSVRDL